MSEQQAQDAATVEIPADLVIAPAPVPAAPPRRLQAETAPPPRKLGDRDVPEPPLSGLLVAALVVAALAAFAWVVGRKWLKNSRLFAAAGALKVLGRRALGPRQELLLVEVGPRLILVGATREHLSTLGEFTRPEEVAQLRARFGPPPPGEFRAALAEELRRPETPAPAPAPDAYAGIAEELDQVRKLVRNWKD